MAGNDPKAEAEQWWNALERWEKRWVEERKKERVKEAQTLREAEDEYERFSRSPKVLRPAKKVEHILATESREPVLGKMKLKSMESFSGNPPFRIDRIIYDKEDFVHHPIRLIPIIESGKKGKIHEYLVYSLRKALEFQTNGKIDIILEESGSQEFLIKALEGAEFVPLCRVFSSSQNQIIIEIKKCSFPYFHGYSFDVGEIVRNYLIWLQS